MTPTMLRPGQAVALCALALLMVGVVMVNSAGMSVDARETLAIQTILISRPAIYAGLAMLAMALASMIPIRRFLPASVSTPEPLVPPSEADAPRHPFLSISWFSQMFREAAALWPLWACVAAILALLVTVYVPGLARPRNGSHRWISLPAPGLESIQPSEIAKWGMVMVMAWYGARYSRRMPSFWLGLVPGLAAAGLIAGFIVLEDLGTGVLLGLVACVMLIAAGGRPWQLLLLCPAPLAGITLAIITSPYRLDRIRSFVDPYIDPQGKGFHMIQSMVAVANGQVTGRGLGHGLQKFGYLPEDTTDFLFAIVCEELGIAGAALVLALFAGLLWGLWMIVRREQLLVLKLLGLGVLATIGIQAIINLAVVTGLGPTKGIALPLLSSGGTGWILTAAALGLVIAIDREQAYGVLRGEPRHTRPLTDSPAPLALAAVPAAFSPAPSPEFPHPVVQNIDVAHLRPRAEFDTASVLLSDPASTQDVPFANPAPEIPAPGDAVALENIAAGAEFTEDPPAEIEVELTPGPSAPETDAPPAAAQPPVLGAPGETGFLFDMHTAPNAAPGPVPDPAPSTSIVITSEGRMWPIPGVQPRPA